MSLFPCQGCARYISPEAGSCPHCGRPVRPGDERAALSEGPARAVSKGLRTFLKALFITALCLLFMYVVGGLMESLERSHLRVPATPRKVLASGLR